MYGTVRSTQGNEKGTQYSLPYFATMSFRPSGGGDAVAGVAIHGAEKRREGGKHYVYHLAVTFTSGKVVHVWRRYSQFDALRETMLSILGPTTVLPKLTSKRYLVRSSVQAVAENRRPKLQSFLTQLLGVTGNLALQRTLLFFLTPTAEDNARLAQGLDPLPDDGPDSHDSQDDLDEDLPGHSATARASMPDVLGGGRGGGGIPGTSSQPPAPPTPTSRAGGAPPPSPASVASAKPTSPIEELRITEAAYVANLVNVRDAFFPKMRHCVTAGEAKKLFNNWAELIPFSEVCLPRQVWDVFLQAMG